MLIRGNFIQRTVLRGNVLSGNCPFMELPLRELSIRELSFGEMSSGNCPLGKSPSGKYPSGNCSDSILPWFIGVSPLYCFVLYVIMSPEVFHEMIGPSLQFHKIWISSPELLWGELSLLARESLIWPSFLFLWLNG